MKMAVFLKENALRVADFSTGAIAVDFSCDSSAEIRFYLHKEFRVAEGRWGGDATENGDFQRGKVALQGAKNFFRLRRAMF